MKATIRFFGIVMVIMVIALAAMACDTGSTSDTSIYALAIPKAMNKKNAVLFRDSLNAIQAGSAELDYANSAQVNLLQNLVLTADVSIPSGVTLAFAGTNLTVNAGITLNVDGSLILADNAVFTVNGTVNAKGTRSETNYGIVAFSTTATPATINGNGVIHLKTPGFLLANLTGMKFILDGSVILDGLTTATTSPVADVPWPAGMGIGGDPTNNIGAVVYVQGTFEMRAGIITGNTQPYQHNTFASLTGTSGVNVDGGTFIMSGGTISGNYSGNAGGAVEVNNGGSFTMSGNAVIAGNKAWWAGGVFVKGGATFTMQGNAAIKSNTAYGILTGDLSPGMGGGIWVARNPDGNDPSDPGGIFILEGGTVYGSGAGADANTVPNGDGASLYVIDATAKWGASSTGISGGDGGGSAGGDIVYLQLMTPPPPYLPFYRGGTDDTLNATSP